MSTENELINKSYYQTIIDTNKEEHPIKILGEMYKEEMQKERPELSAIRFAQGEVYFLNHDYEAAIYKWQYPLDEQFISWAQKNIADTHMEMGLLEHAEKFYMEVQTESVKLKSEVLLQLFSLYIQQGQHEKSVNSLKKAVKLNPDYTNVTEIAQTYFEDIKDWDNAVELAVNEAIRTESLSWFEILEGYARQGFTSNFEPNYFNEVLVTLLHIDPYRFESLTEGLWNSYKQSDVYVPWLEAINQLLLNHRMEASYICKKLPNLFEESYFYLISGGLLIEDISNLVKNHLTNWIELSSVSDTLASSTAILAWEEIFPTELAATLIHEAEHHFENSTPNHNGRREGMKFFDSIKSWAEKEGLLEDLSEYIKPMLDEFNMDVASPSRIRNLIKAAIEFMLEQKVELENVILEEINWNEEVLTELHDIQSLLGKMEKEKATIMADSFRKLKNSVSNNVKKELPKILRNCSELVKEDSDFSKLHIVLNEEMNKRIADYMENDVLIKFKQNFEEWIEDCEREFQDSQNRCTELAKSMNQQFHEEKMVLSGDFKVLDDWKRDIERISRGALRFDKVNILLRNNPSQLLLKGVGKVLGSISKNKDMLHSRYKNYIENADYSEIAGEIIHSFIQQLELFEESIKWDVNRFISNPQTELHSLIEEVQVDIEKHNDSLNRLREKPEIYRDPLTLFELKLRQYELMNRIS
ncbi:lipopolysaccharide assembly protein LapB [Oceanobacillus sp. Castelsardo]|uniref:tetratricopeptide repeat protein n=1 Tax=Oceanobacillus sp. Castelsardo TaxID=1851204 RepID=UPI0008388E07|nr:hypothetical protein [Oceanobacillus sp. Castelsardo]